MDFSVSCKLPERTVEIDGVMRDVYGVASVKSDPQWQGLGRMMLKWAEEKARRDGKFCCVGFAVPVTFTQFFKKAGWHCCGIFDGRIVTASIPAKRVVVHERW